MSNVPSSNKENSRKGDDTVHQKSEWDRAVNGFKVAFTIVYLGSIFIGGISWFTGTTDFLIRPWSGMWFIFRSEYPHGTDTRVDLVPEKGKEREVNMDQWFKYEVAPGRKRYSELWSTSQSLELATFLMEKNFQTPMVQGPVKSVKVTYRWWPITRGRRPTEADRAKGQTQIDNFEFKAK